MYQEVIHEDNAKGEEMCVYEKRLVLVLLLIIWKSGAVFFANRVV